MMRLHKEGTLFVFVAVDSSANSVIYFLNNLLKMSFFAVSEEQQRGQVKLHGRDSPICLPFILLTPVGGEVRAKQMSEASIVHDFPVLPSCLLESKRNGGKGGQRYRRKQQWYDILANPGKGCLIIGRKAECHSCLPAETKVHSWVTLPNHVPLFGVNWRSGCIAGAACVTREVYFDEGTFFLALN